MKKDENEFEEIEEFGEVYDENFENEDYSEDVTNLTDDEEEISGGALKDVVYKYSYTVKFKSSEKQKIYNLASTGAVTRHLEQFWYSNNYINTNINMRDRTSFIYKKI